MTKGLYFVLICFIGSIFFLQGRDEPDEQGSSIKAVLVATNQKEDDEMTEELLKSLYRQVNQAMVDKDTARLEALLKPDTILVHMTGYSQPVREWLNQIETEEMKYYSWQEEAIKDIVIDGHHASLTGQSRVKARIWGSGPSTWPLQIHMSFEKIDGQWAIVKQVASIY